MREPIDYDESKLTMIARRAPWSDRIEIAAFVRREESGRYENLLGQLIMTEVHQGAEIVPAAHLTMNQAQELMDTLYQAGVRPTRATETSHAALQATQDHLKDMQTLLGKQMDVNLGGKP